MNGALKFAIRSWFAVTTREQATQRIENSLSRYLALARLVDAETGARSVTVPSMPGVDPDMRQWSYYMILEHNVIVNQSIRGIVSHLVTGDPLDSPVKDPKTDVMPTPDAGTEQVDAFRDSVEDYLSTVALLGNLRTETTVPHPVFGDFNAHRWHCMFGFHLNLHYRQAERVVRESTREPTRG